MNNIFKKNSTSFMIEIVGRINKNQSITFIKRFIE